MKKFTGEVFISNCDELIVNRNLTWVHIFYKNADAPIFEEGRPVTVKSQQPFPPTLSKWTNEHGQLITDRVRGKYYLYSDEVKVEYVST